LDEYSFAPVGSVGWVHLQGEFTCINQQYIAENRKPEDKPKLSISTGTGFFITKSGHIVTSSHVISNARSIKIVTESKTVLDAHVIKNDPANDVAILKVDYSPDHSLPLMLDNHVKKGEELVVLGYPLIGLQGQEQKATFGRVNSLSGIRGDTRFIQIDSPIQPGNSGGPVLNQYAEVVGIVTMTVDQAKAYENFGTLTQSVNYALKLDYLEPLLSNIDGFKTSISRKKMPTTDIISTTQNSVVLILVRH
jgi:S1-C subfamily serine protease